MLISRTWHGAVPHEHGDAFAVYLKKTGIQESQSIPGNTAAYVHRVEQYGYSHFFSVLYGLPGKLFGLMLVRFVRWRFCSAATR